MSSFKIFLWVAFVTVFVIMSVYSLRMKQAGLPGIVAFEVANEKQGKEIVAAWSDHGMLRNARVLTYLDFLFLVLYVALMISCSSDRMNLEKNRLLNSLLRFNIALAVVTGLLDIAENIILLNNLQQPDSYVRSFWITWPKFVLAGWIVLIWLMSMVKKWVS